MAEPVSELSPSYYLVHDTPAGPRYAYPVYLVEPALVRPEAQSGLAWEGRSVDGSPVPAAWTPPEPPPRYGESGGPCGWLVTAEPIVSAVARWTRSNPERGPWQRAAMDRVINPTVEQVERWRAAAQGSAPSPADLEHLNGGHGVDACVTCQILRQVYVRGVLPRVEMSETVDFSGWSSLPSPIDDAPDLEWYPTDTSALAVYGAHTAHMWPGHLAGLRDAVVAALHAHPWVVSAGRDSVYKDRYGGVTVSIPIMWDVPRPRSRRYPGEKGRGPFYDRLAVNHRKEHRVPDEVVGRSKADAIARWDGLVAEWVDRFIPSAGKITACSACSGRGWNETPTSGGEMST